MMTEVSPLKKRLARLRHFLPAAAFIGGFLWDAFTLGRVVTSTDLWLLGLYYLGALAGVLLLLREWNEVWRSRLTLLVQFCFGSMFSALVVCYFKSSGCWSGLFVVAVLATLLVANEFLQNRYTRTSISWSLLCLVGIMYLNFTLPHLVHRIGTIWFILSSVIGLGVVWLTWKISGRGPAHMVPPLLVAILLMIGYFGEIVPPVPLVVKQHMICTQFKKEHGEWLSVEEEQPLLVRMGIGYPQIHHAANERIYYLSSVFAPSHVEAELEHRWFKRNAAGDWQPAEVVRFAMIGGRGEGWRLDSHKATLTPGLWRVETALRDGAVIGRTEFEVTPEARHASTRYKRNALL